MKLKLKDLLDETNKKYLTEMSNCFNIPQNLLINTIVSKAYESFVEAKEAGKYN